jgi:hypothetical protein
LFNIGFWWLVASALVGLALAGDMGLTDGAGRFVHTTPLPVAVIGFTVQVLLQRVLRQRGQRRN